MTSFRDRFLLAAMVAAAEGRFGLAPAAVEEVRDRLRDLERRAARRRVQAVARGQLELVLDVPAWPALPVPVRREPGDVSGVVALELRRGQDRRRPTFRNVSDGTADTRKVGGTR